MSLLKFRHYLPNLLNRLEHGKCRATKVALFILGFSVACVVLRYQQNFDPIHPNHHYKIKHNCVVPLAVTPTDSDSG